MKSVPFSHHVSRILCALVLCAAAASLFVSGCGGGGGGGGGGSTADTTSPTLAFTTPNPSGSLSYEADPDSLPASLALNYSDTSGVTASTFAASFSFRGQTIDLSRLFTAGSSSATTSSDTSPLYWTVLIKYNMNTDTPVGAVSVLGASSASTGALNLVDVDETNGILYVAATSRKRLIFVSLATGQTTQEVVLPGTPTSVRACPSQKKVYVAFQGSNRVYAFTTAGATAATITVAGTPKAMALNPATAKAYVIYENSTTMTQIDCAADTASNITLGNIPQRLVTDGLAAGRVYYAGGIGAAKGVYRYAAGSESLLYTLTNLPEDITFDSVTNRLFTVDFSGNYVSVHNASTGAEINNTGVGTQPFSLRSAAALGKVYALNKGNDTVSVISASGGVTTGTINLNATPVGMAADASGGILYVLVNLWEVSASTTGVIQAWITDKAGNRGSTSLTVTVNPVSTGGPGAP